MAAARNFANTQDGQKGRSEKTRAGAGDRHCARALPLVKRETDELRLPATLLRRVSVPRAAVAWSRGGATLVAATTRVAVLVDDASIAAVEPTSGADRWTTYKAAATAVAASDEYVAVGFDDGRVEVRAAADGAARRRHVLLRFPHRRSLQVQLDRAARQLVRAVRGAVHVVPGRGELVQWCPGE